MDTVCLALVMTASLILSASLVPATRVLAARQGVLDPPGERKVHQTPMPRLGGIAVFASFTAVVMTGYLLLPHLKEIGWGGGALGSALDRSQRRNVVGGRSWP